MTAKDIFKQYAKSIDEQFQTGITTEHSYRPALQKLLSELLVDCIVINEPARIQCGAPDYIITQKRTGQPVFFVEAKDVFDPDLDGMRAHKEQFDRYKASLDYIIFTDYLDFHVYEHGEWIQNVRLVEQQGTHLRFVENAGENFIALIEHLAASRPQSITSPARLAKLMAAKARLLANVVGRALKDEEIDGNPYGNSQLLSQLKAFRNILIHDLTSEGFADIYAQTIAYGMFAARLHDETPEDFSRHEAATLIPKTNPFLRTIFQQIAGYDLDDRIAWIVDDLAQTFVVTDLGKVMKTYIGNALHSDPMIHFYEDFLSEYNPDLRKSKGVWYTPQPVVNFIVRAVDEILQRDFHLPMGLADSSKMKHEVVNDYYDGTRKSKKTITCESHRVQILDPATGTGTFLAEVVRQIYQKFQGMEGMWPGYVEDHLLPRLHGFELLMASYAVAHLKLDLQLRGMGYDSAKARGQRMRIYLTNSLEECHPDTGTLWANWLSTEATEANYIKRDCPVMVMVGNPPYSISSSNKGEWINTLVDDYKKNLNERNIQPLSDDYIKFIRLGQNYVERNGQGILGYISNNSFVDGVIHREMRHQLLLAFDDIYILNLHGNTRKKEQAPDGSKDENVFDIMQGVSINIFVRKLDHKQGELGRVFYKDLYGSRDSKYEYLYAHSLVKDVDWKEVVYSSPEYCFVQKSLEIQKEYKQNISLADLMPVHKTGVATGKDSILICDNTKELLLKVREYFQMDADNDKIEPYAYRPFDHRFIYYDAALVQRARVDIMKHMMKENTGIMVSPNNRQISTGYYFIIEGIIDRHYLDSILDSESLHPLYLYKTTNDGIEEKTPNLNREEWAKFDAAVGRTTTPEELLNYIYGVLHSPAYRERYKEFLKIDFPRIPLPENEDDFMHRGEIGRQLIDLHLMRDTHTWQLTTTFPESGDCMVDAIKYRDGRVMINATQYFGNVPAEAWNAYIGGYQPAQKWLKDRKGRVLSFDDINHYRHIIHALTETVKLMNECD